MEKIKDEYRKLKEEIHNLQSPDSDKDFVKLVSLKEIDPELKETLILLHSNYKTELNELKSLMVRTASKLIDQDIELVSNIRDFYVKEGDAKTAKEKLTSNLLELNSIQKTAIGIIMVMVVFWVLNLLSPSSFEGAANVFKSIFSSTPVSASSAVTTHDTRPRLLQDAALDDRAPPTTAERLEHGEPVQIPGKETK